MESILLVSFSQEELVDSIKAKKKIKNKNFKVKDANLNLRPYYIKKYGNSD